VKSLALLGDPLHCGFHSSQETLLLGTVTPGASGCSGSGQRGEAVDADIDSSGISHQQIQCLLATRTKTRTPRDAFFSATSRVEWEAAAGCVSAELLCPYPPGIPAVAPGELLTAEVVGALRAVVRAGGRINGASDGQLSSFVVLADKEA
jgi:arginine/lysine/ornithine decarboxylase